jgi:hypothetical protein
MKTNRNVVATTQDWLKGAEGMRITAYDPSSWMITDVEPEIVEPGTAVNLSAAERAKLNRARPGVRTPPERL